MVEDGSKTHSIRAKRKPNKLGHPQRSPHVGEIANCYVNPRRKTMRLLGRWPITRVEDIRIRARYESGVPVSLIVWVNDEMLDEPETNQLCWRDGFRNSTASNSWREFSYFWRSTHGHYSKEPAIIEFRGDLIHWDFGSPVERKKVGK